MNRLPSAVSGYSTPTRTTGSPYSPCTMAGASSSRRRSKGSSPTSFIETPPLSAVTPSARKSAWPSSSVPSPNTARRRRCDVPCAQVYLLGGTGMSGRYCALAPPGAGIVAARSGAPAVVLDPASSAGCLPLRNRRLHSWSALPVRLAACSRPPIPRRSVFPCRCWSAAQSDRPPAQPAPSCPPRRAYPHGRDLRPL
jgi:hypothetical protein